MIFKNKNLKKKNVGIVIGRFQNSFLTKGHIHLLKEVFKKSKKVIVFVGVSGAFPSIKNPLSFDVVKDMLLEKFKKLEIFPIRDNHSDMVWSKNLDTKIKNLFDLEKTEITLYGSRESFKDFYFGKFKFEYISEIKNVSATFFRNSILIPKNKESYRLGMIDLVKNIENGNYATSFQVVEIILYDKKNQKVLLGKKNIQDEKYCLFGGFVDPKDKNLEESAKRELFEEANYTAEKVKYLMSSRVNDFRYKNSKHKIMSAVFVVDFIEDKSLNLFPKDDIKFIEWIKIEKLKDVIYKNYLEIVDVFLNSLKN